jgi:hypothetical protein
MIAAHPSGKENDMSQTADEQSQWKSIYKLGGWVSLVFILYSLVTMALLVVIGGQPETAVQAFEMLQENRLIALMRLDILTLFVVPFYYVIFLGIYVALRRTNLGYATLATLISCAGVTLVLATPSVFSWLSLSHKFAAAATDIQRDQLLAAGEAILAADMWHGSGAIIGGMLMLIGVVITSIVMLQNQNFGKATAYVGVITHGLDLLRILVSFFAPAASFILMAIAGPFYLVWFPLLARDFFKLSRRDTNQA